MKKVKLAHTNLFMSSAFGLESEEAAQRAPQLSGTEGLLKICEIEKLWVFYPLICIFYFFYICFSKEEYV